MARGIVWAKASKIAEQIWVPFFLKMGSGSVEDRAAPHIIITTEG